MKSAPEPARLFRRSLLAGAAVLAGLASPAPAQTLGGKVIDQLTHLPISGLFVATRDSATVIVRGRTDSTGVFYLSLPRGGAYRLYLGDAGPDQMIVDSIVVGVDEFVQRTFAIPFDPNVYPIGGVEKQVRQLPGGRALRYPDDMRQQHIEGVVIAQFIVDSTGRVREGSLRITHTTDERFVQAVRDVVPGLLFEPATINGRRVAQLVRQPYTFVLSPGGGTFKCPNFDDPSRPKECLTGPP